MMSSLTSPRQSVFAHYTPAPPIVGMGVYWVHPDGCPSVCPSVHPCVDKVSGTLKKTRLAQFISYLACTPMGWVFWSLFNVVFLASFLALWRPNIWLKMGFPELFEKAIGSIHFIPSIWPHGVNLLTPIHFRVSNFIFGPLVAKYLTEIGLPKLFEKTFGSIHFIPSIYPYGVSLLTPTHFRVPTLIFDPLVAKYLAKNGVSGI